MKTVYFSRFLIGLGIVCFLVCALSLVGPVRVDNIAPVTGVRLNFHFSFSATTGGWILAVLLLVSGITFLALSKKGSAASAKRAGMGRESDGPSPLSGSRDSEGAIPRSPARGSSVTLKKKVSKIRHIVLILAVSLLGACSHNEAPSIAFLRGQRRLVPNLTRAIITADEIELISIDPKKRTSNKYEFQDQEHALDRWQGIGSEKIKDKSDIRKLAESLEQSIQAGDGSTSLCFDPHHAL